MPRTLALLYVLVAISGCAGLIYEVLWIRALGLHFGTTTPAITTVVATFMGGLGLGNWLFGRQADRSTRPFELYARIELGIAVTGLLVSLLVLRGGRLLDALSRLCEDAGALSGVVRTCVLAALMLVPATLMGGTLPVLARALSRHGHGGRTLGLLYACNTFGAIGGALLPDFALIPFVGLTFTACVAVVANLCVAGGLRVLHGVHALPEVARVATATDALPDPATSDDQLTVLALTATSGFAAMGLEVLWSRTLQHWASALVTSFSVLLAVYLAAFAIGAFATRRVADRARRPLHVASWLLGATGVFVLAAVACGDRWRDVERALWPRPIGVRRLGLLPEAIDALLHASFLEAVPCLLMGASFPFVAAAYLSALPTSLERTGEKTGQLFTVNTLAGVLGALITGFVLLPALGEQGSYIAIALLMTAVAATSSARLASSWAARAAGALALAVVLVLGAALPNDQLLRAHFRSGAHVVAVREGSTTTAAAAVRTVYGELYYAELLTPGVSMSSTGPNARRYMAMMAHAALFTAHSTDRALLICYGVGNTASALLSHASLKQLDVVDISREVLSLAPRFARARGENPLRDPRVRVFIDDGRHYLVTHEQRYDVITAEPPPPSHAGVVNLYSRELYALAARRLTEGGVITQWLPVFELSNADVRAMIAAFVAELPHTALLYGYKQQLILIGSKAPLSVDATRAALAAAEPRLARDLLSSGIGDLDDVLGSVLQTDAELRRAVQGIAPLTDDLPSIQYAYQTVRDDVLYTAGLSLTPEHAFALLGPTTTAAQRARVSAAFGATAAAISALPLLGDESLEGSELLLGTALLPALRARPDNAGLWGMLSLDPDRIRAARVAVARPGPHGVAATWTLARYAYYGADYERALTLLAKIRPAPDELALHALLRAQCLRGLGRVSESDAAFRQAAAASRDPRFAAAVTSTAVGFRSSDDPARRSPVR